MKLSFTNGTAQTFSCDWRRIHCYELAQTFQRLGSEGGAAAQECPHLGSRGRRLAAEVFNRRLYEGIKTHPAMQNSKDLNEML